MLVSFFVAVFVGDPSGYRGDVVINTDAEARTNNPLLPFCNMGTAARVAVPAAPR